MAYSSSSPPPPDPERFVEIWPPPRLSDWVETYLDGIGSVLREGGSDESNVREMVETYASLSEFHRALCSPSRSRSPFTAGDRGRQSELGVFVFRMRSEAGVGGSACGGDPAAVGCRMESCGSPVVREEGKERKRPQGVEGCSALGGVSAAVATPVVVVGAASSFEPGQCRICRRRGRERSGGGRTPSGRPRKPADRGG